MLGMGPTLPGQAITTEMLINRVGHRFNVRFGPRVKAQARLLRIRHLCRDLGPGRRGPAARRRAMRTWPPARCDWRWRMPGLRHGTLGYLVGHTATPDTLPPREIAATADGGRLCRAVRQVPAGLHRVRKRSDDGPRAVCRRAGTRRHRGVRDRVGVLRPASRRHRPVAAREHAAGGRRGGLHHPGPNIGDGDVPDNVAVGCMGLDVPPGLSLPVCGAYRLAPDGVSGFTHDYAEICRSGRGVQLRPGLSDVRAVIPHQVNGRHQLLAGPLGIPAVRILTMARRVANTGSATIWAALAELRPTLASDDSAIALGAEATFRLRKG